MSNQSKTPAQPLPSNLEGFRTIIADPPWPYGQKDVIGSRHQTAGGSLSAGVSSRRRYGAMSIKELCTLPVASLAAPDAHLYLWTTNSFMEAAHAVARAWGFDPKTILTWVKVRHSDGKPSMKTGYYFRGATEHCLFCVRGKLRLQGRAHPTVFLTPRPTRGHSAKPDYFFAMVEKQSPGPRLELFARPQDPLWPTREGWNVWGNEVGGDVEIPAAGTQQPTT